MLQEIEEIKFLNEESRFAAELESKTRMAMLETEINGLS